MKKRPFFHSSTNLWRGLKPKARQMRHEPTRAEDILWQQLRNRALEDLKFRRQYTIGQFVVDFVCLSAKIVIEVDGEIHIEQQERDELRTVYLESQGFRVIRFTNQEVIEGIENVLEKIVVYIHESSNNDDIE